MINRRIDRDIRKDISVTHRWEEKRSKTSMRIHDLSRGHGRKTGVRKSGAVGKKREENVAKSK